MWRMFENRTLRGTFRRKKQAIIGELRKLHDEALNFYSTQNINTVMLLRKKRCMRNVTRMEG
jgi:hypothetical protein